MRFLKTRQLLSIFALVLVTAAAFAAPSSYNEIYQADGTLRPQYQVLGPYLQQLTSAQETAYLRWSRREFANDNAVDPVPRILTEDEYNSFLVAGVQQRALAIQMFLQDHYSGQKAYASHGIVSASQIDTVIARTGETGYAGQIDPHLIAFMYGPDVIRDGQGQWRVIEDNPGFIGGLGDLKLAYELMLRSHPELQESLKPHDPTEFYKQIARGYKERAAQMGGKAILYMTPPYADNEDSRLEALFAEQGIETIVPESHKKLIINADGAYLKSEDTDGNEVLEKVGFVFLNGEHAWLDNSHKAAKQRNIIEAANNYVKEKRKVTKVAQKIQQILNEVDPKTHLPDLKALKELLVKVNYLDTDRSYAKGLLKLILNKKIASNYSPGVDFIGDKEFYVHVENFIRFYLHQEPIIKNIETASFGDAQGQVNEVLLQKTFQSLQDYVIKRVDGRGGDAVWVGPKINPSEIPNLIAQIRQSPNVYIVQTYTPLSVMRNNIVDLRVIADVAPNKITVTNMPWGRGLPQSGNGKVNLSDQGREVVVLISDRYHSPVRCEGIF